MNARNIVISREQAETILDQETCDRLFAAGTDVRQVENACFRLGCLHQAESMLDPAALRRFDLRLDMPVADEQTAIAIIQSRLVELAMSVDDIAAMAACAAGLAPALIVQAVDTVARRTLLESDITMIDGGLLTGLMEQARVDTGEERRASDA